MRHCGCRFQNILCEIHRPIVTLSSPHYHPIMTSFDTPFLPHSHPITPKALPKNRDRVPGLFPYYLISSSLSWFTRWLNNPDFRLQKSNRTMPGYAKATADGTRYCWRQTVSKYFSKKGCGSGKKVFCICNMRRVVLYISVARPGGVCNICRKSRCCCACSQQASGTGDKPFCEQALEACCSMNLNI